jgi:hypothetical protein
MTRSDSYTTLTDAALARRGLFGGSRQQEVPTCVKFGVKFATTEAGRSLRCRMSRARRRGSAVRPSSTAMRWRRVKFVSSRGRLKTDFSTLRDVAFPHNEAISGHLRPPRSWLAMKGSAFRIRASASVFKPSSALVFRLAGRVSSLCVKLTRRRGAARSGTPRRAGGAARASSTLSEAAALTIPLPILCSLRSVSRRCRFLALISSLAEEVMLAFRWLKEPFSSQRTVRPPPRRQ